MRVLVNVAAVGALRLLASRERELLRVLVELQVPLVVPAFVVFFVGHQDLFIAGAVGFFCFGVDLPVIEALPDVFAVGHPPVDRGDAPRGLPGGSAACPAFWPVALI